MKTQPLVIRWLQGFKHFSLWGHTIKLIIATILISLAIYVLYKEFNSDEQNNVVIAFGFLTLFYAFLWGFLLEIWRCYIFWFNVYGNNRNNKKNCNKIWRTYWNCINY